MTGSRPEITIVVAMTRQRVIGRQGRIPWHIPDDLKLFRELTTGHTVIMGRETFESIGRPLLDRRNIVVSRTLTGVAGVEVCRSLPEALRQAGSCGRSIFIIGGEQIYRQAMPLADFMVVSWIGEDYAGDTFFPDFDPEEWSVVQVEEQAAFSRVWYRRRKPVSGRCPARQTEERFMPEMTLTCPHCGFARALPAEKVPQGPVRVTCPKCGESFAYHKPAIDTTPPETQGSSPPSEAPSVSAERPAPAATETGPLRGIGELFRDAWEIYTRRVGVLMGLYLLSILFLLLPVGVFALFGVAVSAVLPDLGIPLLVAGTLTGLLLGSIALLWGLAGLVLAVADESLDIRAALQGGWTRVWAFAWVFALTGFIVTGGFLLLIVPGIIFSVWFFLAQFVLAAEDERGMRALLKSKAYMEGRFFEVFLRLFAVWVVSVLIGMVPLLGAVLSLLFVPFMMICGWLIYDDLRPKGGSIPFTCTAGDKATWITIGALGFLIVPLIFLFLAVGWLGLSLSGLTLPWRWFGF